MILPGKLPDELLRYRVPDTNGLVERRGHDTLAIWAISRLQNGIIVGVGQRSPGLVGATHRRPNVAAGVPTDGRDAITLRAQSNMPNTRFRVG